MAGIVIGRGERLGKCEGGTKQGGAEQARRKRNEEGIRVRGSVEGSGGRSQGD